MEVQLNINYVSMNGYNYSKLSAKIFKQSTN